MTFCIHLTARHTATADVIMDLNIIMKIKRRRPLAFVNGMK